MVQRNIAPPSLAGLLHTVAKFDDSVFERIASELAKPTSTNLSDEQYQRLCSDSDVEEADLRLFISFISFLYSQTEGLEGDVTSPLRDFLLGSVDDDLKSEIDRLSINISRLLNYRTSFESSEKRTRLTRGFLPFVIDSSSFVDLRTDFIRDRNGKLTGDIEKPVVIVQLMLTTDSLKEQERQTILQLDQDAVHQLQSTLNEILEKIRILGDSE